MTYRCAALILAMAALCAVMRQYFGAPSSGDPSGVVMSPVGNVSVYEAANSTVDFSCTYTSGSFAGFMINGTDASYCRGVLSSQSGALLKLQIPRDKQFDHLWITCAVDAYMSEAANLHILDPVPGPGPDPVASPGPVPGPDSPTTDAIAVNSSSTFNSAVGVAVGVPLALAAVSVVIAIAAVVLRWKKRRKETHDIGSPMSTQHLLQESSPRRDAEMVRSPPVTPTRRSSHTNMARKLVQIKDEDLTSFYNGITSFPNNKETPDPLANTQTDPLANTQTDPLANTQTDPLVNTQPDPLANTQTDPLANTQTDPLANTQTDPLANTQTDPLANTQTDPLANTQTDPLVNTLNAYLLVSLPTPSAPQSDVVALKVEVNEVEKTAMLLK